MDRFSLFSTPVLVFAVDDVEELDAELCARLVAEARSSPGVERSNAGGWHSVPDLSLRQDACYRRLMQIVVERVRAALVDIAAARGLTVDHRYRFGVQGWAMVMEDGDYAVVHDHAEAHFSVVHYADAGDVDLDAHPSSGALTFVGPRAGGAAVPGLDLFPGHFSIEPRTGLMVVFPGWLPHFVHPYRGTRPRVSISCNVRLEPEVR
ncbi:MAG TPA: putative 2OG-Fe(II) oxygenase [Kofleriaceae bacterium]|nr:putative 2OG-Fe(II) oxygenase [Kofleriaceae bacterium]